MGRLRDPRRLHHLACFAARYAERVAQDQRGHEARAVRADLAGDQHARAAAPERGGFVGGPVSRA